MYFASNNFESCQISEETHSKKATSYGNNQIGESILTNKRNSNHPNHTNGRQHSGQDGSRRFGHDSSDDSNSERRLAGANNTEQTLSKLDNNIYDQKENMKKYENNSNTSNSFIKVGK